MINVRMPTSEGQRLVQALLIAAGAVPRPTDPEDRKAYLDLAEQVGDRLADATHARPIAQGVPTPVGPSTGH